MKSSLFRLNELGGGKQRLMGGDNFPQRRRIIHISMRRTLYHHFIVLLLIIEANTSMRIIKFSHFKSNDEAYERNLTPKIRRIRIIKKYTRGHYQLFMTVLQMIGINTSIRRIKFNK